MNIGLDFDGVLVDCNTLKSVGAKKLFGRRISSVSFSRKQAVSMGFLTAEEYNYLQETIYSDRSFMRYMCEVPNALFCVRNFLSAGHTVRVVTSRSGEKIAIAREWLKNTGLHIPVTGVGSGTSKIIATAGLDLFVDDDLDKLTPLIGAVPRLFLFSPEHDRNTPLTDGIERVSSWNDLHRTVSPSGTP